MLWEGLANNPFMGIPLAGLSCLYGLCVHLRKRAYDIGLYSKKRLPYPVISIGNLTVGGTGKTPIVGMVARALLERDFSPIILSRGYKRKNKADLIAVSDGEKVLATPEDVGDEPYMLADWLHRVPIVVSKNRYRSGVFAMKMFEADCFILDDGFQHLNVFREKDILVINARDPFGGGKLLPWGRLREPLQALERASLILINKSMPGQDLNPILEEIRRYNSHVPIIETLYMPEYLVAASDSSNQRPLSSLKGKSVLAFSGIADPDAFLGQLNDVGAKVEKAVIFEDHHWFSIKDMGRIRDVADSGAIDLIVTTEKDGVRLPAGEEKGEIYILRMKMSLKGQKEVWNNVLSSILVRQSVS